MKLENLPRAVELSEKIDHLTNVLGAVILGWNNEGRLYPEEMLRRHTDEKAEHLKAHIKNLRSEVESL